MADSDSMPSAASASRGRYASTERGDVVGGFHLLREIGRGGMAEVWVARKVSSATGKFVALKMVLPQYIGDERYSRMFATEAEVSAPLSHGNIVQVFDEGEDNGRSYIVMEWVDGVDLSVLRTSMLHLQQRDPYLRLRLAAYIIGQVLYGLSYAHKIESHRGEGLGIVHRDISPQNILVSVSGDVKVTDFGIAHRMIEETSGLHIKGKVRYMSSEQLSGQSHAPTVDLYAVGALLHELLDGRKFRDDVEDQLSLYREVMNGTVPALHVNDVPPELDEVRRALLHPDPRKRVQTADAALLMLKRWTGYSEMKVELATLCGLATGVMRPRTGPLGATTAPASRTPSPSRGAASQRSSMPVPGSGPLAVESDAPIAPWGVLPSSQATGVASAESTTTPSADGTGTAMLDPSEMPLGVEPRFDTTAVLDEGTDREMILGLRDSAARAAAIARESAARARDLEPTRSAVQSVSDMRRDDDPSLVVRRGAPRLQWLVAVAAFVVLAGASATGVVLAFSKDEPAVSASSIAPSSEVESPPVAAASPAVAAPRAAEGPTFAPPTPATNVMAPPTSKDEPPAPKHAVDPTPTVEPASMVDPLPTIEPTHTLDATPTSEPKAQPPDKPATPVKPAAKSKAPDKPSTTEPAADAPQAIVRFRLDKTALPSGAEVLLGKRRFTIASHLDVKVAAGKYSAKWRAIGASKWSKARTVVIGSDAEWKLYVSANGVEVTRI